MRWSLGLCALIPFLPNALAAQTARARNLLFVRHRR
jgi:hypothetical protein